MHAVLFLKKLLGVVKNLVVLGKKYFLCDTSLKFGRSRKNIFSQVRYGIWGSCAISVKGHVGVPEQVGIYGMGIPEQETL